MDNKSIKNIEQQNTVTQVAKMEKYIEKEFEGRFNLNTIIPQLMITFKSIKKTTFTDEDSKKNVE